MAIKRAYLEELLDQMKLAEEAGCTLIRPVAVYGAINGYPPNDVRYKNRTWYGYRCRTTNSGDPFRDECLVIWTDGDIPHDTFKNSVVFLNSRDMMYVTGWKLNEDKSRMMYFLRILPTLLMMEMERRTVFFFHTLDHRYINDLEWSELDQKFRIIYPTASPAER